MQIYLARDNNQAGPYQLEQLNQMLASEQVDMTDLMWHEGMSDWKTVAEVTGGVRFYSGNPSTTPPVTATPFATTSTAPKGLKRTSVDDLKLIKSKKTANLTKKSNSVHSPVAGEFAYPLANTFKRLLAVLINYFLFYLALMPLTMSIDIDADQLGDFDGMMEATTAYTTAFTEALSNISQTNTILSIILVSALVVMQIILLAKRGQSLGKLATGIRVLDTTTSQVPKALNIISLRTLLINVMYNLPLVGPFILLADVILLFVDKNHQSLHDKLASTYVAKAKPEQIKPVSDNAKQK